MFSNGQLHNADDIDINLEYLGENKTMPNAFKVEVGASNKTFRCVFHFKKRRCLETINDDIKGWEVFSYEADCTINVQQGKALITSWYRRKGKRYKIMIKHKK